MRLIRAVLAATVFSAVFVWSTPGAGACSCGGTAEQELFDRADVVFEATVTERADIDSFLAVLTYEVTGVYKGDARQTQPVYTHAQESACGLAGQAGDTYFVFAKVIDGAEEDPGYPIGDLRANYCGGTRLVDTTPLDLDPPVEPVAPIADAPTTTTTTLVARTSGADDIAEPFTGGGVLVVGFITVGIVGAFVAARLAKRSRET